MDNRKLKKYVTLVEAKKQAEADLEAIKEQMIPLEEYIMENMLQSGTDRTTVDGYTVYVQRQLWASSANGTGLLHNALNEQGYGDLVEPKVNAQRLSALVREFDQNPETQKDENGLPILPGSMREAVKITEKFSVRARKAS